MKALLILGDQLFSPIALSYLKPGTESCLVYMREDMSLASHGRYHKHKLILFFTAMRDYADELRSAGYIVHYEKLGEKPGTFENCFENFVAQNKVDHLEYFEIQDEFFEDRINDLLKSLNLSFRVSESPMFLTSRKLFKDYLGSTSKPFMKTFYQAQRRRLNILMDEHGKPEGGQWSFDEENRLKLPKDMFPIPPSRPKSSPHLIEVSRLIEEHFPDNPGQSDEFWLPTDREGARLWLNDFLTHRLHNFGKYEDALPTHASFVFHSVLTPFLNTGLLTPSEVVKAALAHTQRHSIPLNSIEGFVRQVIGWREFVRGIYQNYRDQQKSRNFWNHHKKLSKHWWDATTGIEPLDSMIKKCLRYAYAHHIERLMVAGNLMLLLEVDPHEAHQWFMEMFIDSADWVMGPNVYGMALFSDGGIFATKPYICGSNYYRKMGTFKDSGWQMGVDGLYWSFIKKHRAFFESNSRLKMIVGSLDRMEPDRLHQLQRAGDQLRNKLTYETL